MVKVKERILEKGARNRPSTRSNSGIYGHVNKRKYICIHETGNYSVTAGAANHAAWLYNNPEMIVGYHFTVDHDKIYQHIPITEGAWHATDGVNGEGNLHSIGIEICVNQVNHNFDKYLEAVENAAWLCAKLVEQEKSLNHPDCLRQHNDFYPQKNCPRQIRNRGMWDDFVGAVGDWLEDEEPEWGELEMPQISRPVGVEMLGEKLKEIGFLARDPVTGTWQTYLRAGFTGELPRFEVTGHGDHIKINPK